MAEFDVRGLTLGTRGGAVQETLKQLMLEEEQRKRDEFNREIGYKNVAQRQQELDQQAARDAAAEKQRLADLDERRQTHDEANAARISAEAKPGDIADATTQDLMTRTGRQGQMQGEALGLSPDLRAAMRVGSTPQSEAGRAPMNPTVTMRGGINYEDARAKADERAYEKELDRAAKEAQDKRDNDLKLIIARLAHSTDATSRELSNQLKQIQIDTAKDKLTNTQSERAKAETERLRGRDDVRSLAVDLIDDKSLDSITGPIEGRRDTFWTEKNAATLAKYNSLVNKISLEGRSKLKGQGQISDFEGRMLANASTALNRASGPVEVRRILHTIADVFDDHETKTPTTVNTNTVDGYTIEEVK